MSSIHFFHSFSLMLVLQSATEFRLVTKFYSANKHNDIEATYFIGSQWKRHRSDGTVRMLDNDLTLTVLSRRLDIQMKNIILKRNTKYIFFLIFEARYMRRRRKH